MASEHHGPRRYTRRHVHSLIARFRRAPCSHYPSPPRRRSVPAAPQPPPSSRDKWHNGAASVCPAAPVMVSVSLRMHTHARTHARMQGQALNHASDTHMLRDMHALRNTLHAHGYAHALTRARTCLLAHSISLSLFTSSRTHANNTSKHSTT
jgi:hypothetical protein